MPPPDPWEAKHRTFRSVFSSTSPQRANMIGGVDPTSPSFERSGASVLGPGSYDVSPLTWVREPTRKTVPFKSGQKQRVSLMKPITADLDFAGDDGLDLGSKASTMSRQKWTGSDRWGPQQRMRARGLDEFYAVEAYNSIGSLNSRKYASSFQSKVSRLGTSDAKVNSDLGPGSYDVGGDCLCGGVRTEDPYGPSRAFAPSVRRR